MKIQPIDSQTTEELGRFEPVKPMVKSRLKRLLERQFNTVLRISSAAAEEPGSDDSVCLDKMVENFIEESNEKRSGAVKCGPNDRSDDELDSHAKASQVLKSLVICDSVCERTLLADTAMIVEKNNICKRKDDFCRRIVTEALLALGYNASLCKSRWGKSSSCPAGEYEYLDVLIQSERLLIDIDFRSEFEIARSTKAYKSILNILPHIFVGKSDRLQKIIGVVSDAAMHSLKKKGLHVPPWRKFEYVKSKWLSPTTRLAASPETRPKNVKPPSPVGTREPEPGRKSAEKAGLEFEESVMPPAIKLKSLYNGGNMVTGDITDSSRWQFCNLYY